MAKSDKYTIDSSGNIHNISNGTPLKNPKEIVSLVEEYTSTNSRDEDLSKKMGGALTIADKNNKSRYFRDSALGLVAIVFGGIAAAFLAVTSGSIPLLLLVNGAVVALVCGDQVFRVNKNFNTNNLNIDSMCEKLGIKKKEITKEPEKSPTKSKDMVDTMDMDTAPVVEAPKSEVVATNVGMGNLGNVFKSATPSESTVSKPTSESVVTGVKDKNLTKLNGLLAKMGKAQNVEDKASANTVVRPAPTGEVSSLNNDKETM